MSGFLSKRKILVIVCVKSAQRLDGVYCHIGSCYWDNIKSLPDITIMKDHVPFHWPVLRISSAAVSHFHISCNDDIAGSSQCSQQTLHIFYYLWSKRCVLGKCQTQTPTSTYYQIGIQSLDFEKFVGLVSLCIVATKLNKIILTLTKCTLV